MEPVRGGALARNRPPQVVAAWDAAPVRRSPAEWALQWVWSIPEVSFLLSGMGTMQHVEENLEFAGRSRPGLLSAEDKTRWSRGCATSTAKISPIPCTACRYCMPCPQGVAIPEVLQLRNDAQIYDDVVRQRVVYGFLREGARAEHCTACRECEEKCPQEIDVSGWMEEIQTLFGPAR